LEEDRDRIAVLNIEKRGLELLNLSGGSLTAPTAPQMTDVTLNRCGEPSPFQGGEEVSELAEVSESFIYNRKPHQFMDRKAHKVCIYMCSESVSRGGKS